MPSRADRGQSVSRYPLRFGTAALILTSITLVLVLFVIPQRYVLSPGFRESGVSFPTPTTPFVPVAVVPVTAPLLPAPPAVIASGPAELLWEEVTPLLDAGQLAAAVPVFESYLTGYPGDTDVRRELAITLLAAGRTAEAVGVLRTLLEYSADPEIGLLLARTLRELGRVDEAGREYDRLVALRPADEELALEWAQAHAWALEYERAAEVLAAALTRIPESVLLRLELARAHYAMGRVEEAATILLAIDAVELAAAGGTDLSESILSSYLVLTPGVVSVPPLPTPLERATTTRFAGDVEGARAILEEALRAAPDDGALWLAYADLLEYELADVDGALRALLEAERLGASEPVLQLRVARLELAVGRNDDAASRLETLLAALDSRAVGSALVPRSEVLSLRGDLHRWAGERGEAARRYRLALAEDPDHASARDGLAALDDEMSRQLEELERPGVSGLAYTIADTDDFRRFDAGGSWVDVAAGRWVWSGSAGQRWLDGLALDGSDAHRHGVFVDLELARWWLWGALRTGLDFGVERVRSSWDARVGGSLRYRGGDGTDTQFRLERGPAHPLANTLQSALADVVQERLLLTHTRALGGRWSLGATVEGARLHAHAANLAGPDVAERVQLALSVGRAVGASLTLGVAARALTFTDAAPTANGVAGLRPLYWDPRAALSGGPYASLDHELGGPWRLTGRLNPGLALIDERRVAGVGYELVPHVSAEAGARLQGRRFSTALDLFFYQGQFDGYRSYGARLTVSARDLSASGGAR